MVRAFAFGAGFFLCALAVGEGLNQILKRTMNEPLCDGDFTDEEIIEADGFITCYMSGPIRPIPRD